jgi:FkbM family methyltransferase
MKLPRLASALLHLNRLNELRRAFLWTESWWLLTCAYLQIGAIPYPIKLTSRSGLKIEINNYHDCVTIWVIFCRIEYFVPANAKIIIDLGANFGAFTLFAADAAKNCHIFSIEPFPKTFDRLSATIRSNQLGERVTCLPLAIASNSEPRKMSAEENVPDQSRGLLTKDASIKDEETFTVETASLTNILEYIYDKLGTNKIDLVKMDIEGRDHEWLPNIDPHILDPVGMWQMEYHPNGTKKSLFQVLESAGFYCSKDLEVGSNSGVAHFERK